MWCAVTTLLRMITALLPHLYPEGHSLFAAVFTLRELCADAVHLHERDHIIVKLAYNRRIIHLTNFSLGLKLNDKT